MASSSRMKAEQEAIHGNVLLRAQDKGLRFIAEALALMGMAGALRAAGVA